MAPRGPTFYDAKPHKPIRYGLFARVADWRFGRSDGEDGIPGQPDGTAGAVADLPNHGLPRLS